MRLCDRREEVFNEEPETGKEKLAGEEMEDDKACFLKIKEGVQDGRRKETMQFDYLEYLFS